ncbi:MAG: HAMP domain-containing histidine kinase [Balneolaceae bacterium]|nr:HAMP domain-containing histidine kinase [Balneolaceae bacterium]
MKLFNTYDKFISNPWVIVLFGLISGVAYIVDSLLVDFPLSIDVLHVICSAASFGTLAFFLIWRKHNWNLIKALILIMLIKLIVLPFLALHVETFSLIFLRNSLFYWGTIIVIAIFFGPKALIVSSTIFLIQYISIALITGDPFLFDSFVTVFTVFLIYVTIAYLFINQIEAFITNQENVQKELKEQSELLKQSNTTKGKLLSIIGHDLRSPLMSLTSLAVLIKEEAEGTDNDDLNDYIGMLGSTADQTSFLVNNLLEWSRSQESKIKLSIQPIRLEPFLYSLHDLVEFKLSQKNITLDIGPLQAPELHADQSALQAVLRNLVTNAIKFTNPGGKISISTHSDDLGCYIILSDNGIGMDKETLRSLQDITSFESKKGTSEERGTGIGFNLCIELMHLHNGHIKLESELKKGTKITLFFPFLKP